MTMNFFDGVWTALVTPFDDRGEVDWGAFEKLIQHQIRAKVSGVVPCGTTGESPTLTPQERRGLIERTVSICRGTGVRVAAGTGSNNTHETLELSKYAEKTGADACLVVTPYYNKPTFSGIKAHYQALAEGCELPLILYHIPGRTQVSLTAEQILELAPVLSGKSGRPCAIKEASGNFVLASKLMHAQPSRPISLLSSDDILFWPLLSLGARGLVSVASNLYPELLVQLHRHWVEGKISDGQALHRRLTPLFDGLFIETNPSPIKYALFKSGFCKQNVRLPLVTLSSQYTRHLDDLMADLQK
jgi:4-hydroxy-tetrahydrodipicolinate synthase